MTNISRGLLVSDGCHEPCKLRIIFFAPLLPIQCACVPSPNVSLDGSTPRLLQTVAYASFVLGLTYLPSNQHVILQVAELIRARKIPSNASTPLKYNSKPRIQPHHAHPNTDRMAPGVTQRSRTATATNTTYKNCRGLIRLNTVLTAVRSTYLL